jgi:hypothetical protein
MRSFPLSINTKISSALAYPAMQSLIAEAKRRKATGDQAPDLPPTNAPIRGETSTSNINSEILQSG